MSRLTRIVTATAAAFAASLTLALPTQAQTSGSDLRVALNNTLSQHVYLAAAATGAALGGRSGEFKDAAGALDSNSVALSKAIGSVYGAEAETAFLSLWREHIGIFVDYATGVAKKDKKMQDAAVRRLVAYADDFAAFLASANPNLPKDAVAGLVREHVTGLKAVVDAQGKREFAMAYNQLRTAAAHMQMIADPLASAIARQFPEKYAMK
jgi:hypothetical protein